MKKVLVVGLDCFSPNLLERHLPNLKTFSFLIKEGTYKKLCSTTPPITIPAWLSMFTGKDPGQLGLYGVRKRTDFGYSSLDLVSSADIPENSLVWEKLKAKSIIVSLPPGFPPRPKGIWISCFLTPSDEAQWAYPESLKDELKERFGPFIPDVENFRSDDKEPIKKQIFELTEQRFEMAKYLLTKYEWEVAVIVDIAPDRLHHAFWKFFDPAHPKFPGEENPYRNLDLEYYRFVDEKLGELLEKVDTKTTEVFVVSDHGAKGMKGGFCINEWMIRKGYLRLKREPQRIKRLSAEDVLWKETSAWGEGGYYARVFINVEGREPEGKIPKESYNRFRRRLKEELERELEGTKAFFPEEIYSEVRGIAPDLIVVLGDLEYRSIGSVGVGEVTTDRNDLGPDDANHDWYGIYIRYPTKEEGDVKDIREVAREIERTLRG